MLRYMLDTNIAIYTIRNKPEKVRKKFNALDGQMCLSSVTLMELYYGVENSKNIQKNLRSVEGFASRLAVLEYGDFAAASTGRIRAARKKKGTPIGTYDAMIAGHARSLGLILVTNDETEFSRVDGLEIENWTK